MNRNRNGFGNENNVWFYLKRALLIIRRVEDGILVALLTTMIGTAVLQILLRNLFGAGIVWGDILVRVLVLWIGLIGSMVAARQDKHISIDLVARYLPGRFKATVKGSVELFAAVFCALVAHHSLNFVRAEFHAGDLAFGQIPVWVCEAIIPFAFGVIALRYFVLALMRFFRTNSPAS